MLPISAPVSRVESVVDILHGVPVTDPYRWLEDQNSPETRTWLAKQTRYARTYLDNIPARDKIRDRVRELLDIKTYDSFLKVGDRYFFRKRQPGEEQACIYFRQGANGEDHLLVDPAARGAGNYVAVRPLRVSCDGGLLLYEVKQGGERTGTFEILDIVGHKTLPDSLPRGYLRGFAFAPDSKSFYYSLEAVEATEPFHRAVFHHIIGTSRATDRELFFAGSDENLHLAILPGASQFGLLVYRSLEKIYTDFYLWHPGSTIPPRPLLLDADYGFAPRFHDGQILALTDRDAPNFRIVQLQGGYDRRALFSDVVAESGETIRSWSLTRDRIFVTYARGPKAQTEIFDCSGKHLGEIPCEGGETLRVIADDPDGDEIIVERESFNGPIEVQRYSACSGATARWSIREVPFDSSSCVHTTVHYQADDGASIPMFLVGRSDLLAGGNYPVIMTAYGGHGISMTPRFSAFVAFLIGCGCVFALPNIRGGSEFGAEWHNAAKRRNRQVAFADFLSAVHWLIQTGRTQSSKLAIFGGSNSGLLVCAAMTQRPDLFRAVLPIAPLTDMLRYHLFDGARSRSAEYGTADDLQDFSALLRYSPYHNVRKGEPYPATIIVSGDADGNCNPLHARKLIALLQAANASASPIVLDYNKFRGHSPVLPLGERIRALTDRLAFLVDQLELSL